MRIIIKRSNCSHRKKFTDWLENHPVNCDRPAIPRVLGLQSRQIWGEESLQLGHSIYKRTLILLCKFLKYGITKSCDCWPLNMKCGENIFLLVLIFIKEESTANAFRILIVEETTTTTTGRAVINKSTSIKGYWCYYEIKINVYHVVKVSVDVVQVIVL